MKKRDPRDRKLSDFGSADAFAPKVRPDEVLQGPGFTILRHGRYVTIDSRRTKDEQRRLTRRLASSGDALLREIGETNQKLEALIHRYNSLELLAHISLLNTAENPNTYKEYESSIRPSYIEHLALLELKDRKYETRSLEMPDGLVVKETQALLDTIFHKTVWYRLAEATEPDDENAPGDLEELRFRQALHELVVRSPTYYDHWCDVLRRLFGSDYVVSRMENHLGFSIESALKLVEAVPRLEERKLASRMEEAREHEAWMRKAVDQFKRTGTYEGPKETRELVNEIRNLRGKDAKRALTNLSVAWAFFDLAGTLSFTIPEIAAQAGLPEPVAGDILGAFSLGFGTTKPDYMMPELTHQLKLRPLIRYRNKYFCPTPHLLLWAIKPMVESKLKPSASPKSRAVGALWQRYQKQRANFLVRQGLEYFKRLLPRATVYENLSYLLETADGPKLCELDGLVLFDKYAFFVEGKAGEFSPAARRGAPGRLIRDLKDLVAEPHVQAMRALQYVSSATNPVFFLPNGRQIELNKADQVENFLVTISLDHFDNLTAALFRLRGVGILPPGDLPWSINLSDLRIIAETLSIPVQFTHYLKWRLHINHAGEIYTHAELNWLGIYLAEGPQLLTVPDGYNELSFTTYMTAFDDYYLYEMGERTRPAERPSQYIPSEMRSMLDALEELAGYGYSSAGETLLDLNLKERDGLAACIAKSVSNLLKATGRVETVRFQKLAVELWPFPFTSDGCRVHADDVSTAQGRNALVFSLKGGEPLRLAAWALSRNSL